MPLSEADRREVEIDFAKGMLEIHQKVWRSTFGTTEDQTAKRRVCKYCLVPWPCKKGEWALDRKAEWVKLPVRVPATGIQDATIQPKKVARSE